MDKVKLFLSSQIVSIVQFINERKLFEKSRYLATNVNEIIKSLLLLNFIVVFIFIIIIIRNF